VVKHLNRQGASAPFLYYLEKHMKEVIPLYNRSEFPKWVGGELVRDEEQESAVVKKQVAAAEEENKKLKAEEAAKKAATKAAKEAEEAAKKGKE